MGDHNAPLTEQETLAEIRDAVGDLAETIGAGLFPLNKRETFAAFIMMGLASRLQPLHTDSPAHQSKVVKLSFSMADAALEECQDE